MPNFFFPFNVQLMTGSRGPIDSCDLQAFHNLYVPLFVSVSGSICATLWHKYLCFRAHVVRHSSRELPIVCFGVHVTVDRTCKVRSHNSNLYYRVSSSILERSSLPHRVCSFVVSLTRATMISPNEKVKRKDKMSKVRISSFAARFNRESLEGILGPKGTPATTRHRSLFPKHIWSLELHYELRVL